MDRATRRLALGLFVAAALLATRALDAAPAHAGGAHCARAVASTRAYVTRSDTRRLSRCMLAILEHGPGREADALCAMLHVRGEAVHLTDERSRKRLERRCERGLPEWLEPTCSGPGPVEGAPVSDAATLAGCVVTSAHCFAVEAAASLFPDFAATLAAQSPPIPGLEVGGDDLLTFAACLEPGGVTTTIPASTTTTVPAPTTTLPIVTTTVPAPTTTLPVPTTTVPPVTTTLAPVTTTTLAPVTTTTLAPVTTTTLAPATTTTLAPATTTTLVPVTTTTVLAPTTTTTLAPPIQPTLIVTEIMSNPVAQADTAGEYIEILNAGVQPLDLFGLVVRDDASDSFTVNSSLIVAAGAYTVLGKSSTAAGGAVDYVYGSAMTLANTADKVVLVYQGIELDRVEYDASFPLAAGRATELRASALSATLNDQPSNWCASSAPLGDGDFGTPRAASSCAP